MFARFFRRPGWAVLVALLPLLLIAGHASAEVVTPPKGSPERAAILDAVRPMAEAELGAPVEFVVREMRVIGEWAFVILEPQRPGGGKIEYAYTRYQEAVDEGIFGGEVIALLRETPKGWLTYEYELGSTDVPWVDWPNFYPVPPEIFPH
ncbi:MAG TPA: hypothetical protein VFB16_11530 [Bauldia sp.]|nr:hypothetical protein [Bauldia sp.]